MDTLKNTDFNVLIKTAKTLQMKVRFLALAHFKEGSNRTEIAKSLKVSRTSVNRWVKAFLEEGLNGLVHKPGAGRPSYLTNTQKAQLSLFIKQRASTSQGGRLTGVDIGSYITEHFNKTSCFSYRKQMKDRFCYI